MANVVIEIKTNMKIKILACPYCNSSLLETSKGVKCLQCEKEYETNENNQIDFRLKEHKKYNICLILGEQELLYKNFNKVKLLKKFNTNSNNKSIQKNIPLHLSKELINQFPNPNDNNSNMLDLGCGKGIHRKICEFLGFKYLGIDYKTKEADILGDAHALPFKDNSFEFVLSMAVLEHIQHPVVMMNEVYRVLKPGGVFIGSVSFLEPFHEDSFYHHTILGVLNSIESANFQVEFISPSSKWNGLFAFAQMSLFPMLPGFISRFIVLPLNILHTSWWKAMYLILRNKKVNKLNRLLRTTGSFYFKVIKTKESISDY